jgi:hypothetical protein
MAGPYDDLKRAIPALVDRSEAPSKHVLAPTNLNALLLRGKCLASNEPLNHFAKITAEIGSLGGPSVSERKRLAMP